MKTILIVTPPPEYTTPGTLMHEAGWDLGIKVTCPTDKYLLDLMEWLGPRGYTFEVAYQEG
jgi:hypothetical protein